MRKDKYPYSGYTISWLFYDLTTIYEDYFFTKKTNQNVYNDLLEILKILKDEKLFFPTKIFLDNGVLEFNTECLDEVISKIKKLVEAKKIIAEISRIQGKSIVYNNGKEEIIDNLLTIDSIRFFERQFSISTSKSIWIPISIDVEHSYEWQIKLYKSNAPRLERALKKLYSSLDLKVDPSPSELNKECPIWQLGFKLYPDIEILKDEYNSKKPNDHFSIEEYIKEFLDTESMYTKIVGK